MAFVILSVRTALPVGKEVRHKNCTTDPTLKSINHGTGFPPFYLKNK